MNKSQADLVQFNDGYEALYVNFKLVEEGNPINQGESRTKYFLKLSNKHNFGLEQMVEYHASDEDDEIIASDGVCYQNLTDYTDLERE